MVLSAYLILCSSLSCWIERKLGLLLRNQDWGVRMVGASCYRQACRVTVGKLHCLISLQHPPVWADECYSFPLQGVARGVCQWGLWRALRMPPLKDEHCRYSERCTCLTALCGAERWMGLCFVTKGRQFPRQLLKLDSIYSFNIF